MQDLTLKESRSIPVKIREKLAEYDIRFASQLIAMVGIDAERKRLAQILGIGADGLQKIVGQLSSEFTGKQKTRAARTRVEEFVRWASDEKKELPDYIKNLPPAGRQ